MVTVKEWREQQRAIRTSGLPIELPSGLTVYVRNVPLAAFLLEGGIPDSLTPIVAELISGKTQDVEKVGVATLMAANTAMADTLCRLAIVSPRIVANPEADDEISLEDLDPEDKGVLFGLIDLPARKLERFCQEQKRTLESLRRREAVADESEQTPESEAVESGTNGHPRKRRLDKLPA